MSNNKTVLITIVLVVVVALVAGFLYWRSGSSGGSDVADEQKAVEDLNKTLEDAVSAGVDVTSANPLDAAIPDVNPIESVNPFTGYKNPFD